MSETKVVNLYNDPYDIYMGGPGKGESGYFGNPFAKIMYAGKIYRDKCLELYEIYFKFRVKTDAEFASRIRALKGKILGCFCKPKKCHCDIIKDYLDKL